MTDVMHSSLCVAYPILHQYIYINISRFPLVVLFPANACRRYGKSAVGLNFFCSCLVMLEAVLLIGAVQQGMSTGHRTIKLELPLIIDATFCAGSAMIAFGAVLGKTTPTQLTWLMVGLVRCCVRHCSSCE